MRFDRCKVRQMVTDPEHGRVVFLGETTSSDDVRPGAADLLATRPTLARYALGHHNRASGS